MTTAQTSDTVSYEIVGDIGLIALRNQPVNAASASMRGGIYDAVTALDANPDIRAIAVWGDTRAFIAGADISEFGKPIVEPSLPDVCLCIENSDTPVVAIVHGPTLGGGLEVAMSAHARIGHTTLLTGFPEVTLGVLPGSGGTQRGPRLIGIRATLDLATSGRRIGADEALKIGLVDQLTEAEPREAALSAARGIIEGELATRSTAGINVPRDDAAIAQFRTKMAKTQGHMFAPHKIVDLVELSTGDFSAGMQQEREGFFACVDSPQRAGLIHAFFSERAVTKIPEAKANAREIASVGVVGGGTMGSGIATALLLSGLAVVLVEQDQVGLDRARSTIAKNLDGAVKRGKLDQGARDQLLANRLTRSTDLPALSAVDMVIEAVFEDMVVKRQIFSDLDRICDPGTILATNTSYLDVNEIAKATSRPEDVIGLHFFSPAHIMRLLEVVVANQTAADVVATGFALAKRLKKVGVRAGVCDGFIGNRVLSHYRKVADYLILDGASPSQVDDALTEFGFAMGPFAVLDLAGLDIGWAARKRRAPTRDPKERYVEVADKVCENGWFGRKSGRGYYVYGDGGSTPNPNVDEFIAEERARKEIRPQNFSSGDIVDRYMTAMISEAARVLEDGIALRPVDIDAVFLFGYGFPRWRGGPMLYADTLGAPEIVRRIENYAKEDAFFWQVPPILRRMADDGSTFAEMNSAI